MHGKIQYVTVLHSAFMLCIVYIMIKREFEGHALNSHGNYIVDHGKSRKNHGIVFLNFFGNPALNLRENGFILEATKTSC